MCYISLQNEARKLNHQEVVEEDKRLKLPANWEAKKARLEWELTVDQKKKVFHYLFGIFEWSCSAVKLKLLWQFKYFKYGSYRPLV